MAAKKKIEKQEIKQIYTQLQKTYYSDLDSNNLLYAKIIRSPISKGVLKSVKLNNQPANTYLFTAADFGEQNYIETLDIQTEILASSEVHYKGQPIAILAGPDFYQLENLSTQIEINIEKSSLQKQKEFPYAQRTIKNGKAHKSEEFSKLFGKKNFDIKGSWTSALNAPSCNEPNGAFCSFEKNILTICTPTQWPKHLQENLCRVFNLKQDEVLIKKTVSFSPHTNTIWINTVISIQAALVTLKTGRPVKLILSRDEQIEFMVKKSPITIKIRTAVKKDGIIDANQILIELDSGYHNPFAAEILDRLVIAANNYYSIRNFEIIAKAYESNNPPVSFNIESIDSQAFFAIENQIQKISKVTGFLPTEIRLKNYERKLSMPFSFSNERVKEAIASIEKQSDLNRKHVAFSLENKNKLTNYTSNIPLRGIGISCGFNGVGYYGSNIFACNQKMDTTLETDGSFTIHALPPSNSTFEIWKNTVSNILELEPKHVKLNSNFNSKNDLTIPESINSNLTIMNYLLQKCCLDIQSKRFRKPLPISSTKGITASQKKSWNKDKFSGIPFFISSHGVIIVEVEVNPYTYQVIIRKIIAIINAGKIALPKVAETSVKLAIQHTLSELIEDETLDCNKISISFMNSENEPIQIDGLISKILPAAFASAVSQAINTEITSIPIKIDQIFKEISSNENTSNSK